MSDKIKELQRMINESNSIVFFGGAGVSTASGIPDFRSEEGLYNGKQGYKYPPEVMLSRNFFYNKTDEFFKFYKDKMLVLGYEPCATHKKLVELENIGKLKAIITQNVDGLHQKAGSKNVIEIHGTIHKNYCTKCHKEFSAQYIADSKDIPKCNICNKKSAIIKPHVVLYGENLPSKEIDKAEKAIKSADMLIVAGTSLSVYPAAGFIDDFKGKYLVIINKGQIYKDLNADLIITDDMNKVFESIEA